VSGGRFCVGAFGRNLALVAVKMFSLIIYFVNLNAICKDNAAVDCFSVEQKSGSFPPTSRGHTLLLVQEIKRLLIPLMKR
jgi:hypothetical protein